VYSIAESLVGARHCEQHDLKYALEQKHYLGEVENKPAFDCSITQ